METFVTSLTTSLGSVATDALSAISGIVPVALPVMGAIVVVGIAIKIFKKVTGR